MKTKISQYRKLANHLVKEKLDRHSGKKPEEEQKAVPLFLKDESEMIESHSARKPGDTAIINPGIIEYLESRVNSIPLKKRVTIEIEYGGTIPGDPFLPEKLIKKHLEESILVSIKRNTTILLNSFQMVLVGIVILVLINLITYFTEHPAFRELFVVVSWVFIWRFVELFFFERIKLRFRRMKLLQIHMAEYRIKGSVH